MGRTVFRVGVSPSVSSAISRVSLVDRTEPRERQVRAGRARQGASVDLPEAREQVRRVRHHVPPAREGDRRVLVAEVDLTAEQQAHRMQLERELGDDAEVATAAAERPEELGILCLARRDDGPVGGDDGRCKQIVEREPERRAQMPETPAERQAGDARVAEGPAGRRETVNLTRRIEVVPERTAAAGRRPLLRVDDDLAHEPQVDRDRSIADAVARDTVAAAADRHGQVSFAGEPHGRDDVRGIQRTNDHLGSAVDHPVERRARTVVAVVARSDDRTAVPLSELDSPFDYPCHESESTALPPNPTRCAWRCGAHPAPRRRRSPT